MHCVSESGTNSPYRARSRRHKPRRGPQTSRGLVHTVRSTSRTEKLECGAYSLLERGVGDALAVPCREARLLDAESELPEAGDYIKLRGPLRRRRAFC